MSWFKAFGVALGFVSVVFSSALRAEPVSDLTKIKSHFSNLISTSCDAKAEHCLAVGFDRTVAWDEAENHGTFSLEHKIYKTDDGGETWGETAVLSHGLDHARLTNDIEGFVLFYLYWMEQNKTIACDASGQTCVVAGIKTSGEGALITHATADGGLNWHEAQLFPMEERSRGGIDGLACAKSGEACLLLSYPYAYASHDQVQTWSESVLLPEPPLPYSYYDAVHMSCSDSGLMCTVVVGKFSDPVPLITYATQDGGLTWREPYVLDAPVDGNDTDFFSNISCDSSGSICMALRHQLIHDGLILRPQMDVYTTSSQGVTWEKTGTVDSTDNALYEPFGALDCDASGQTCVAVHSPAYTEGSVPRAYITHDRGHTWTGRVLETPVADSFVTDIFCHEDGVLCQVVGIRGPLV